MCYYIYWVSMEKWYYRYFHIQILKTSILFQWLLLLNIKVNDE